MKTDEELHQIIRDNEFFLPADSNARIVFFDKEGDEVIIEANAMMGSPFVGLEGEILEAHHRAVRYALRLKLKFSDFFMVATEGQAPQRDIAYSMQKLDEALKKIEEYENAHVKKVFDEVAASCENLPLLGSQVAGLCAHATGKHDQECDLVAGLNAELKNAREEVFDLYHQACLVHPRSSDDPIQEFQYDNMCLSTYEAIEEKLIEWGLLKPEQCLRRKK